MPDKLYIYISSKRAYLYKNIVYIHDENVFKTIIFGQISDEECGLNTETDLSVG